VGTGGPSFDIACLSPRASSYLGYFHHDVGLSYRKWSGQVSASAEPIEWQLSGSSVGSVRTFCTASSRADTARTRRRFLRPALAPAPLRERAGRLARDTVGPVWTLQWLSPGEGGAHFAEPPPSVQPAARPDPSGPSVRRFWVVVVTVPSWSHSEGPDGSGVNGLTPGPLRLLGRLSGRPEACRGLRAPPSPSVRMAICAGA
jgi:hypothetical protein